jgi:hypothetical protein
MKAVKLFLATAAVLALSIFNSFADNPNKKANLIKPSLSIPAMNWGSPEDVSARSVESLKTSKPVTIQILLGSPDDVEASSVKALKSIKLISNPEMVWGDASEVNAETVLQLKQ